MKSNRQQIQTPQSIKPSTTERSNRFHVYLRMPPVIGCIGSKKNGEDRTRVLIDDGEGVQPARLTDDEMEQRLKSHNRLRLKPAHLKKARELAKPKVLNEMPFVTNNHAYIKYKVSVQVNKVKDGEDDDT